MDIYLKPYCLFLDDIRMPTDAYIYKDKVRLCDASSVDDNDWTIVRTYDEFVKQIENTRIPDIISFDHDLAEEHMMHYFNCTQDTGIVEYGNLKIKTGKHCAEYLVQKWKEGDRMKTPRCYVHSANRWGTRNIEAILNTFLHD